MLAKLTLSLTLATSIQEISNAYGLAIMFHSGAIVMCASSGTTVRPLPEFSVFGLRVIIR